MDLFSDLIFGLDFYNSFINAMTHTFHSDIVSNDIAKTTLSNKNEVNWTWSNTINYNFKLAERHDIGILAGAELSKQSSIDFFCLFRRVCIGGC
mgnify:CR=1 FL=1